MKVTKSFFCLLPYASVSKLTDVSCSNNGKTSYGLHSQNILTPPHDHRRKNLQTKSTLSTTNLFSSPLDESNINGSAKDSSFENGKTINLSTNAPEIAQVDANIPPETDSLERFENDVKNVFILKAGPDKTLRSFLSTVKLSYTNLWTSDMWHQHNSRSRFFRYIVGTPTSRLFRRTLPQIAALVTWSTLVVFLSRKNVVESYLNLPMIPLSLVSTFVAALLTLRSNQGLSRLNEARVAWGRCILLSRDLAQQLASYVYPMDNKLGLLSARHLSAFGWLLKCRLRDENDTDIVQTILPYPYSSYINSQRKKPCALILQIRQILFQLSHQGKLTTAAHRSIENNLLELNRVFGICERLRGSPIPPVYTAHTSRLLVFYLVLLPCALLEQVKRGGVIVAATAMVGFAMLGLDEISHVLEQPFRVVPMHPMAGGVMRDVADAFICQPPIDGKMHPDMREKPSYW